MLYDFFLRTSLQKWAIIFQLLKKGGGVLLRAGALIKDNTVKHYPPYYHAITMNHNNQNLP